MNHKTLQLVILGIFTSATIQLAYSQSIQAIDINAGISSGNISVSHSTIDIGTISNIFSGDNELARSAAVNPFVVTLEFSSPISLAASRVLMTYSTGNWYITTASNLYDLDNATGTYSLPFSSRNIQNGVPDSLTFPSVNCTFIRLHAQRTSGDNYVHLNSWNLYAAQTIDAISLKTPHNETQLLIAKPFPIEAYGIDNTSGLSSLLDNSDLSWWSSDNAIANVANGTVVGLTSGFVTIFAQYNGITESIDLEIIEDTNAPDLSICYIKRLPEIDYVTNSSDPTTEGWPAVGREISWRAYVRNFSPTTQYDVTYQWLLNGHVLESGSIAEIPAYDMASATLPYTWTFERHELEFQIDIANTIQETEEANNSLMVYTNAISVGFYVEQYVYDYFHTYQSQLNNGTNSWDNWAQYQVKQWNIMMAEAIYPLSPNGVLDRIRLDSIAIVPNGSLPLHGGLASNNPNILDKTVDLQWGFASSLIAEGSNFYGDTYSRSTQNPFFYEKSLFHELGHARYLHDNYLYDVHYGNEDGDLYIRIRENGNYIGNTEYMPVIEHKMVHDSYYKGLMSDNYTFIDEYCAVLLNFKAGQRALCGNMNAPCDINARINDLPTQNSLTLKDQYGNLLNNAHVTVYQVSYDAGINKWVFEDNAALTFEAEENGSVAVGRCPFTQDGHIDTYYNGCSELYCIIRVEHHNRVGYQFIESSAFNMEYWKGNTDNASYNVEVPMIATEIAQSIVLQSGWNLISFSLFISEKDIGSVFAPALSSIECIKTTNAYYTASAPEFLNTLKTIKDGEAYLLKLTNPVTLTIQGTPYDLSQTTYILQNGLNMIGSYHNSTIAIETMLSDYNLNVAEIKNFEGFWVPQGATNSLSNFNPHVGYFVKME